MFSSFRDWRVHVNVPAAFSTLVLDKTDITSGLINADYQINDNNRLKGFYSKQWYKKPNRFLTAPTTVLVEESTSNEDDVFDVYQVLWNSVITPRFFVDARFGLNKILFPTYQNGTEQTLLDTATNIRTRNFNTDTERFRDRYQANATGQYYLDEALGGRHEFKFGFDHAHAPVEVRTRRVDDLELRYNGTTGRGVDVTLFASPFFTKTAVDVTALYLQDSYSIDRLTVTGGLRWERLEGYLPEQASPPSRWFPALQREFPEQRDIVNWKTIGPRLSAAYDINGDGRTAAKASAGRYYYVITTGGVLDTANPNATYSARYTWTDNNGDLLFQPGEDSGTPVISQALPGTISFDPDYERPYTDEYTAGLDHELIPSLRLSAVFTYRREKNPQATSDPANPYNTFLSTRPDDGPDGVAGTPDDTTISFYDRPSAASLTFFTTDRTALQTYKGIEITATKRMSDRWQVLAGYTFSRSRVEGLSVNVNPNNLINVDGPLTGQVNIGGALYNGQLGDRPHQFKLTGTYILPWYDVGLAGNFNTQSGIAVTRQVRLTTAVGTTVDVNAEPLGAHRLDARTVMDLRLFKNIALGTRSLDLAIDFNNLMNANTVWNVRTLSGTIGLRQNGAPDGTLNTVPQFLSPAEVYPPRNIRFNVAYRF